MAVGSRSEKSANEFGDKFSVPRRHATTRRCWPIPTCRSFTSRRRTLHAEWAIRAAEAGKHILCEKPIGVNYAEAMAIVEAARG